MALPLGVLSDRGGKRNLTGSSGGPGACELDAKAGSANLAVASSTAVEVVGMDLPPPTMFIGEGSLFLGAEESEVMLLGGR